MTMPSAYNKSGNRDHADVHRRGVITSRDSRDVVYEDIEYCWT